MHLLWVFLSLVTTTISVKSNQTFLKFDDFTLDTPLILDYMAPFGCLTSSCDTQGSTLLPAAIDRALEYINSKEELSYFKDMQINYMDNSGIKGPNVASDASMDPATVGVIGLSSDCYVENTILSISSKMTIPDNCLIEQSSYKGVPRTFVSFTPATQSIGKGLIYFISRFNWKNVAVVSASSLNDKFHTKARGQFIEQLSSNGVNVLLDSRIEVKGTAAAYRNQIESDMKRARIFVIYDTSKNAALFRKYYQGMMDTGLMGTGDYFVIAYLAYDANRDWIDSFDTKKQETLGGTTEKNRTNSELRKLYQNLLILSDAPVPYYANDDWAMFQSKVTMQSKQAACPPFCDAKSYELMDTVHWDRVQRAYDALNLFATAGSDALDKGVNIMDGKLLYEYMLSRTIESISGFKEFVDGYGNLVGSLQVYYFTERSQGSGSSEYGLWSMGRLSQPSLHETSWVLEEYGTPFAVNWISGSAPLDVPECGFLGEKCAAPVDKVFVIVLCVSLLSLVLLLLGALILFRRYQFERRLHSLAFLIDRKQITLKRHMNMLSNSMKSLASVYGSVYASQAALNNSHFILQDYEEEKKTDRDENESIASVLATGPLKPGQDYDSAKWNNLPDFAVGLYQGQQVALKRIYLNDVEFTRDIRLEIVALQESTHENLIGFLGMMVQAPDVFLVNEMASRGSIKEILDNDELPLDDIFLNQMARDIVAGLEFLHHSAIGCHGRLKSSNCLIDSRWMVRLSSFGLRELRGEENPVQDGVQEGRDDLWTAPELLRWSTGLAQCSPLLVQKADIYSLAVLLYEIFGRAGPWGDEPMEPKDIVRKVKNFDGKKKPFRPDMAVLKDSPVEVQVTVAAAWAEEAEHRPNVSQIKKKLRVLTVGLKKTIMDNMVAMIEKYTAKLEKDINERNQELAKEKAKSEQLLKMMLPPVVADSLKQGNAVTAESFDSVTVYFSDCVGFVEMSATSKPIEIVQFLNDLYTCFDSIIHKYDVYKVETIADAYMVVSGLPLPNGQHHAGEIASMGLALLEAVKTFSIRHRPGERVKLRIGMHSGPCVAGVVGLKMPRYCLFGDTVNTASRMESNGIPLRINCSATAHELLVRLGGFVTEERGMVEMKGKGLQMTYFVTGEDLDKRRERISREKVKYRTLRNTVGGEEKTISIE